MEIVIEAQGNVNILKIIGRFDAQHVETVREQIQTAITNSANIVCDLEEATFLDSAALAVLVQGMKRARQANGDLRICHLKNPVKMIFELTRLDKAFMVFTTLAEAKVSFNG